jgi:hemerythrin
MGRNMRMLLLVLLAGALLVATILTFIALGPGHPVPWLLTASLIAIPVLMRRNENRHYAVWRDEYSVGVDSLDNDHKKLLTLINNLQTAVHYQTGGGFEKKALDEVVDYTKYHFEREEKMMQEAGYADLEAHKELHRQMIAKVEEFIRDYDRRGHEALEDIAEYLKNWLINHINGTDQEYSPLLKQKGMS